ncbi:MAG: AAA domain-containing protein [bacterium]
MESSGPPEEAPAAESHRDAVADPERLRLVEGARDIWIRKLIDHSRRNPLLFFRPLKSGTLELTGIPVAVQRLLSGRAADVEDLTPPVRLTPEQRAAPDAAERERVLQAEARETTLRSLVAIQRKALSNLEEKGLETLHLAVGMATWPAPDGGRPYDAPILLLPAQVKSRSPAGEALKLEVSGEPQANLVLLHVLEHIHGITIDADELVGAAGATEDEDGHWRIDAELSYQFLKEKCVALRGFGVEPRIVLGNFQFAKMAMVEDLRRHLDAMASHPIVSALAGHSASRQTLAAGEKDLDPREFDQIAADREFLVLDADSSQQRAIALACDGTTGVIQGPPGTGKSQTIANAIAELVARGKRVLFVAEKRAALEAVIKRLAHPGIDLGHLVLDLHGASVSRRAVMARLAHALEMIRASAPVDPSTSHREFETRRAALNAHAERMNRRLEPAGLSLYAVQGRLLRLPEHAKTGVRFRGEQLNGMTSTRVQELRDELLSAAALNTLVLGTDASPWTNADVRSGERAQAVLDEARRAAQDLWPKFEHELRAVVTALKIPTPASMEATIALAQLLDEIAELLANYSPEVFDADPGALADTLAPAARGRGARWWAYVSDKRYRTARSRLRTLRKSPVPAVTLFHEAAQTQSILRRWHEESGGTGAPICPDGRNQLRAAAVNLDSAVTNLIPVVARKDLRAIPLAELADHLRALARDAQTPYKLPRVLQLRESLDKAGLTRVVDDIREHAVEPGAWVSRFEHAWLHSVFDNALAADPDLAVFSGRTHADIVQDFIRLDEERLRLASLRVRRLHGERAVAAMNAHPDQADIVRREANKRSQHLGLRKLLAQAPDVLTRIAPCWVASPLSVSQLLDGGRQHFDIVLFDEASQVLVEEAVPALLRGGQTVVAGDRHQLPPTTFFVSDVEGEEDDDEQVAAAVEGFESLLDSLSTFTPNWMLEWHYRSQDERLIAFSNHRIYDDRLVTFPGAHGTDVIRHVLVPHRPGLSAQDESASAEVEEVVRLVLEHFNDRPRESLGVIAMGIRHANRIQAALDVAVESRADIAGFFSLENEERFFVKNLETVQGDERDAIIISVGYGKGPDGDLPHRFGPLTQDVGHRRLNVAATRARRRLTLVSSFAHHEVDLSRSGSRGVQLLKAYLEYAASGGSRLPHAFAAGEVPLNPFEADVSDALTQKGLVLLPQYGASRYRIDMVAMHPKRHGRPVLAIECDGAAYHSTPTARDRDRLRQQHLMRLGWRFHRIWSTDWFLRREEEIERAVVAFQEAVLRADIMEADASPDPRPRAASSPSASRPVVSSLSPRAPRPILPQREAITEYSRKDLRDLARWVASDGLLRTDEEWLRDMFELLPFARLGGRIREHLLRAIWGVRRESGGATGGGRISLVE